MVNRMKNNAPEQFQRIFGKRSGEAGAVKHRPLSSAEIHFADSFTRVMSVLMKSEPYRSIPLGKIENFVAPPLLSGQFAILDGEINGRKIPLAVAFWAYVSREIDERLTDTSISTVVLEPTDWQSGNNLWLIDIAGQPQAVRQLTQHLKDAVLASEEVKIRQKDPNGEIKISRLSAILSP